MVPTKAQVVMALEELKFLSVHVYAGTERWAGIQPYEEGFAISSGDLRYVHNELWWFPTFDLAKASAAAWRGIGSPPPMSHTRPRCIVRRGKLRRWNHNGWK